MLSFPFRSFNQFKKHQASQFTEDPLEPIAVLPSTYSVHDFHSFGLQGSGVTPSLHFHLAGSINAETGVRFSNAYFYLPLKSYCNISHKIIKRNM